MRNTCVISGLSPGFGGVPRLLEFLKQYNEVITPRRDKIYSSIKILHKALMLISWIRQILSTSSQRVTIIHHFSIPTIVLILIAVRFRKVHYFAIDNSFFCIKSYNHKFGSPCLDCVGANVPLQYTQSCLSFPNKKSRLSLKMEGILIAYWVKNNDSYALSESSAKLMRKHFSDSKNVEVLNFSTLELRDCINDTQIIENGRTFKKVSKVHKYNFVFHGSAHEAKGYDYSIKLAEKLPEFTFLFPFLLKPEQQRLKNCFWIDMTWTNGLKELVVSADCVLCPSQWSYTPEAAMLKSLIYNEAVLYMETSGSFSDDIPANVGIRASGRISTDVKRLKHHMEFVEAKTMERKGRDFVIKFVENFESQFTIPKSETNYFLG